jgi:hypothetical protein
MYIQNYRESEAIKFLSEYLGEQPTPSTDYENMSEDIDIWLGNNSYSIKSMDIAQRTNNFAFELEVLSEHITSQDNTQRACRDEGRSYTWQLSWYHSGCADYYCILVGSHVYIINTEELHIWVDEHGFDSVRGLSIETQQKQAVLGHRHINARSGLIQIPKLANAGVAELMGVLPPKPETPKPVLKRAKETT